MEFVRPRLSLTALFALVCWTAGAGATSAQSPGASPGMFRCPDCPLSGQTAVGSSSSGDPTTFIPRIRAVFHEGKSFEEAVIARVLRASPLVLEQLDTQWRTLGRDLKIIEIVTEPARDNNSCRIAQFDTLDLASKQPVSTLRFDDLVTATMTLNRNEQNPDSILGATPVLTNVRRVTGPVAYFRPDPGPGCNRSGRLVQYDGPGNDVVTVYNDGAIAYRDPLFRTFRGRISAEERADLLKAFNAANFNELRAAVPRREWATVQAITLLAARYQYVMAEGEAALAPLVQRMRELRLRALSHTHFLLTAGPPQRMAILPWPYAEVKLAEFPRVRYSGLHPPRDGWVPDRRALQARVPGDFLDRIPSGTRDGTPGTDPGPRLYFKEGERLFRVTKFPCAANDAGCGTFERLSVQEIHDLDTAVRVQTRNIHRTIRYSGPEHAVAEGGGVDPALLPDYGIELHPTDYRWSAGMGLSLAGVPAGGVTISLDEYERHKTAYFPILSAGRYRKGVRLIEGDLLFEDVRLCHIDPGVVDDCRIR
jgi:hypothetical protein